MKCVMHIPWQLTDSSVAATEIRPRKMKMAFEDIGCEVFFICGRASDRVIQVRELKKRLRAGEKFSFLYSESSTLPMQLTEPHHLPTHPWVDANLFRLAKRHGIPSGLFYRDIFWAFSQFPRFNAVKTLYTNLFHRLELRCYNRCLDVMFFPLDDPAKVREKLHLLKPGIPILPLPSGADIHPDLKGDSGDYFVYLVVCWPNLHDLKVLIRAFAMVPQCHLKICTPKLRWEENKAFYQSGLTPNIEVLHLVNSEAQELLSKARYAFNYFPPSPYRQLAVPYKLFEYVGHQLPVIWSDQDAAAGIVQRLGLGYVLKHSPEVLADWLRNQPSEDEYQALRTHIGEIRLQHTWQKRAEMVRDTLTKGRQLG